MKKSLDGVLVGIFSLIFLISGYIVVDYLFDSGDRRQQLETIGDPFDASYPTQQDIIIVPGTTTTSPVVVPTMPTIMTAPTDATIPTVPTEGTMPSVPDATTQPNETEPVEPLPTVPETEPAQPEPTEPEHVHVYTTDIVLPTCTKGGYVQHTCACGDTYQDAQTPANGHSFGVWKYTEYSDNDYARPRTRECAECLAINSQNIQSRFKWYLERNKDVVGWIRIVLDENASADYNKYLVNYPIMHRPENKDYYLYRDMYGTYDRNGGGSIYLREQCNILEPTDVMTIYGHAMADGTMFGRLNRYKTKQFFDAHPYVKIWDLYEEHTYQVVCIFKTSGTYGEGFPYHLFDDFENEAEYEEFINGVRKLAIQDSGIETQYGDKFICLSTCEYTTANGRLVLVAKRIS